MTRPVFVIPHYSQTAQSWGFLRRTLASLVEQSDPDWDAIVVDDGSPARDAADLLEDARSAAPDRIHVVRKPQNEGPGSARNLGVAWAAARHAPFVVFQDADDLAHPDRLRLLRAVLTSRPEVNFVYSTFDVVDEVEEPVPPDELTPSIREILRGHACDPIEGPDQWVRVALDKGYTTPASAVAVRTPLASAHPFPATYVSEDSHTWFRMLAAGTIVGFVDAPLMRRRICTSSSRGSSTRQRFGDDFYWMKLQVDLDGFTRAMELARARGQISDEDQVRIRQGFHQRLARTMTGEQQERAAAICRGLAASSVPAISLHALSTCVET